MCIKSNRHPVSIMDWLFYFLFHDHTVGAMYTEKTVAVARLRTHPFVCCVPSISSQHHILDKSWHCNPESCRNGVMLYLPCRTIPLYSILYCFSVQGIITIWGSPLWLCGEPEGLFSEPCFQVHIVKYYQNTNRRKLVKILTED